MPKKQNKKILQLCLRVPFPERDGGTMAMAALAEGLTRNGHQVDILALNTSKHFVQLDTIDAEIIKRFSMEAVEIDNSISAVGMLTNLLGKEPYHVSRFVSPVFEKKLRDKLQQTGYDLVIFESIFMTPYLDVVNEFGLEKVLRSHNVEYRIWERIIANSHNPAKKAYLKLQTNRLEKFEKAQTKRFNYVAAISQVDAEIYKTWSSGQTVFQVPFGLDCTEPSSNKKTTENLSIGFLGTMSWLPNTEGIKWFVESIWPKLTAAYPGLTCKIAGYEMPDELIKLSQGNLSISGPVPNSKAFINSLDVFLAPLLSGGGVRIKILEAMSMAKPVLATPVGYEGIPAQNGEQIMAFSIAEELLAQVQKMQSDKEYLAKIALGGRELMQKAFNKEKAAALLLTTIFSKGE